LAITVVGGMRFVFVGDSITNAGWFDAAQSTQGGTNLLMQQIAPRNTSLAVNGSPQNLRPSAGASSARGVLAIKSGVNGNKISDIEANIAGRITNYFPDVVVLEAGINDAAAVPDPTPTPTFRASYDNVLATVIATLPSVQIVCLSCLCDGELWNASPSPHFAGNAFDAFIETIDGQIQASALAHGAYYVDVRTALALSESTLNTPAPGVASGILTLDGIHPNATGQRLMYDGVRTVLA